MEQAAQPGVSLSPASRVARHSGQRLGIAFVGLMFLSFHLLGVKVFKVAGANVAPWDLAALAIFFLWANHALKHPLPWPRTLGVGIVLMMFLVSWIGLQSLRSPDVERAITMVGLIIRDLLLLITVGTMAAHIRDLRRLNRAVFLLGAVIAVVSVLLYTLNYTDSGARRTFGSVILLLDSHQIPRLIGLASDPNFFALFMGVSLFCGLSDIRVNPQLKWTGLAFITASIALTISRSALVAIPLAIAAVWLIQTAGRHRLINKTRRVNVRTWIASGIVGIVVFAALTILVGPVQTWTASRFSSSLNSPRFDRWATLTSDPQILVLGGGLRSAEVRLGGRYSHNSYLDILFETGAVGIAALLSFVFYAVRKGASRLTSAQEIAPWVQGLFFVLLMMLSASVVYHPILWVVSAVVLAQSSRRVSGPAAQWAPATPALGGVPR